MESLCQATGSEFAILVFKEEEEWRAKISHNIVIDSGVTYNKLVDARFIQSTAHEGRFEPTIRHRSEHSSERFDRGGSAMIVPLVYESRIYGYSYLANTQIDELFDAQSAEIAAPIATQGAIALQNIT